MTAETERLMLRPWCEADNTELEGLFSVGPWAAIEKASGRWIGRIGLRIVVQE